MPGAGDRGPGTAARAAAFVLALAACSHMGGVRPRITPLPGALERTVQAGPISVTDAIVAVLDTMRVPLEAWAADEGYVETKWIDAASRAARTPEPSNLDHTIKLRFFADPVAGATHLVAECVRRFQVDPSLPPRELEQAVPDSSAGWMLMDSVLTRLLTSQRGVVRH